MSEFKIDKPGFYWQRCGNLAWVSSEYCGEWVVHCGYGATRYLVRSDGIRHNGIDCDTDLVEYIGPTMPETMTRPEPEKKLRPWKPEEVPVGAVVVHVNSVWPSLITTVNAVGLRIDGHVLSFGIFTEHYKWKWPHEPDDAWRPCGVME